MPMPVKDSYSNHDIQQLARLCTMRRVLVEQHKIDFFDMYKDELQKAKQRSLIPSLERVKQ